MAPDITVGDLHPRCDTYTTGPGKGISTHPTVTRCRVFTCIFNDDNNCHANGITLGGHKAHADCNTCRSH